VEFSGPHGSFHLREPVDRDSLFVATGTGVSPLRPMLHHALASGEKQVTLLLGARTEEDLLFGEEFSALAAREPRFAYEPTLSRPRAEWSGRTGYVQTHLGSVLGMRRDVDVYVCGRREMIEAVMAGLIGRGISAEHIHRERFG
jgi:CDP-4-dehydro-6-deoxyglucose reductase